MARDAKPARARPRRWFGRLLRVLLLLGFFAVLGTVTALVTVVWYFEQGLPDIRTASDYQPKEVSRVYASSGEVIAALVDRDSMWRTVVPYEDIPEVMIHAILAAEDGDFFQHPGLDFRGILRAALVNLRRGEMAQGASTITQQVVKNLVLTPERSLRRKIQEALLARRLEQHLSKEQILWLYLNEVFFGVRYYGIEEAARYYFGVSCRELTLEQAALLAGLVQSPNRYNPYRHPARALERRAYVLRQMRNRGWIDEASMHAATEAELVLTDPELVDPWRDRFPWFVDAVRRDLLAVFPSEVVFAGGLQVHTTLRIDASLAAERAMRRGLGAWDARNGWLRPYRQLADDAAIERWRADNGADLASLGLRASAVYRAVVVDSSESHVDLGLGRWVFPLHVEPLERLAPEGRSLTDTFPKGAVFSVVAESSVPADRLDRGPLPSLHMVSTLEGALVVLDAVTNETIALVGGYDFGHSRFNRAVQARRQTGSAFKPFIYAAALDARAIHPAEIFPDQPISFRMHGGRTWSPQNYDGRFLGPMSVREALARSRNVIVVSILDRLGLTRTHAFLRSLGMEGPLTDNLTLALGSAEMTPMEMTEHVATLAHEGVRRPTRRVVSVERRGGDVSWPEPEAERQVIDPAVAWLTGSLMRSVVESGTATAARRLGHASAGKTGTTNGPRDAWYAGWTNYYVAGVWVGRDDNETIGGRETGGSAALPIWMDVMEVLHEGRDPVPWPEPPTGIVEVLIDPATGLRARAGRAGARSEFFLAGTEPSAWAPEVGERGVTDTLLGRGGDDEAFDPGGHDDGF